MFMFMYVHVTSDKETSPNQIAFTPSRHDSHTPDLVGIHKPSSPHFLEGGL